jgi:hypothetical protein
MAERNGGAEMDLTLDQVFVLGFALFFLICPHRKRIRVVRNARKARPKPEQIAIL